MTSSIQALQASTPPHAQHADIVLKESSTASTSNVKERKQAYEQLSTSLESGDLMSAKEAFDSIKKNAPSNWTNPTSKSPKAYAFNELGNALASGNLTAARKAFSDFKNAPSQERQTIEPVKPAQENTAVINTSRGQFHIIA